ncbi:MAG TPA: WS/DGAT domain-containing protein, partial [Myxococcota bacterium]|nr:WS/DGAT domain-containing protein [Myxococcota bacterium]
DPLRRFRRVRKETEQLKRSRAAHGTDLMIRFADRTGSRTLVDAGTRFTSRLHPYHLIVTNVAGPQIPLHLLEARLLGLYPQLPLFEHQGLAVAVMSYLGKVGFGFIGDPDLVPDLAAFGQAIQESFEELREAAGKTRALAS